MLWCTALDVLTPIPVRVGWQEVAPQGNGPHLHGGLRELAHQPFAELVGAGLRDVRLRDADLVPHPLLVQGIGTRSPRAAHAVAARPAERQVGRHELGSRVPGLTILAIVCEV